MSVITHNSQCKTVFKSIRLISFSTLMSDVDESIISSEFFYDQSHKNYPSDRSRILPISDKSKNFKYKN
jgi:hypothetical protein